MRSRRGRERMDWHLLSVRGSKKGIMELQKFHWPIRGPGMRNTWCLWCQRPLILDSC